MAVWKKLAIGQPIVSKHGMVGRLHTEPGEVKVTRCPSLSYDPRYQLPPDAKPFGAGFSAVGVGRDIDTGEGWA